jgi:hypothetical protein
MSTLDKIQKTLAKKIIQNKLSHFLLVNSQTITSEQLNQWCLDIITEYFFNLNQKI